MNGGKAMDYTHILFEKKGPIAMIIFNRPKVLNALNSALLKELSHALDRIAEDEAIRVLVLTGAERRLLWPGRIFLNWPR